MSERGWLEQAELEAGRSGFTEHATQRLDAGDAVYGDQWAGRGVDELLIELGEEAADLGSWGVLARQALELETALEPDARAQIAIRVERAIELGAHAHRELVRARLELKRATGPRPQTFTPDVHGRCLNCGRGYTAHPGNRCRPGAEAKDAR